MIEYNLSQGKGQQQQLKPSNTTLFFNYFKLEELTNPLSNSLQDPKKPPSEMDTNNPHLISSCFAIVAVTAVVVALVGPGTRRPRGTRHVGFAGVDVGAPGRFPPGSGSSLGS